VAGSVGVYDLPDLAASLAPKNLLLIGVTNGNGSGTAGIDKDLSVIKTAYQHNAPGHLQIVPAAATKEKLQEYFKGWIEGNARPL
jgi:hypothetical protein